MNGVLSLLLVICPQVPEHITDIAKTNNGWKILEVGASSCCGLYSCDMDLFVEAMSAK